MIPCTYLTGHIYLSTEYIDPVDHPEGFPATGDAVCPCQASLPGGLTEPGGRKWADVECSKYGYEYKCHAQMDFCADRAAAGGRRRYDHGLISPVALGALAGCCGYLKKEKRKKGGQQRKYIVDISTTAIHHHRRLFTPQTQ
jgi:hypothetical protein